MAEGLRRIFSSWRRVLLLWAAFLLLLGLLGCLLLYSYLAVYEQTRPELYIEDLLEHTEPMALLKRAQVDEGLPISAFEDAQALYAAYLSSLAPDAPLHLERERGQDAAQRAVFSLKAGSARLCTLTLAADGPRRAFGRHGWKLERVGSGDFTGALRSAELWIYALEGQELLLNGQPVTAEYRVDAAPPEDLSALEATFSPVTAFVRYRIAPLYGELALSDTEGRGIPLQAQGETAFTAQAAALHRRDLIIRAPEELRVSVGGQLLDGRYAEYGEGILEGLSALAETEYRLARYLLPGICGAPAVSAVDSRGEALEPLVSASGEYRFFYLNDPEAEAALRPYAERFFRSLVSYTSSAFNDSRYAELLSLVQPGTPLYDYIAQSREAMIWAPYAETELSRLRFDNFHYLSSRCCICTVRCDANFSFSARNEDYRYDMQSAHELAFLLTDQGWLAASMSALAE